VKGAVGNNSPFLLKELLAIPKIILNINVTIY